MARFTEVGHHPGGSFRSEGGGAPSRRWNAGEMMGVGISWRDIDLAALDLAPFLDTY
jgi:hypothetical protein